MKELILELHSIAKIYKVKDTHIQALEDVYLTLHEGDRVFLKGASGGGKSTLINILGCIDNAYSGEYIYRKQRMKDLKEHQRAVFRNEKCGYIFQEYELIETLSVYENVVLPLQYRKGLKKKQRLALAEEMLEHIGLQDKRNIQVKYLSGGQRQRVAIARALIGKPELVLADEAISSLDIDMKRDMLQLIFSIMDEKSVLIFVSHDVLFCDQFNRHFLMEQGHLKELKDACCI